MTAAALLALAVSLVVLAGLAVYWSWKGYQEARRARVNTQHLTIQVNNLIRLHRDPHQAETRIFRGSR